ncbi:hypothetical protein [Desertivirga brevis]|uniref:hypothetical protein n=1 Tax=Desertivirga brevis TaxID=2810310 RepID=UPI001F60CE33|nr:hypothetical protein [Pedobacter sp. SYSU D00873]
MRRLVKLICFAFLIFEMVQLKAQEQYRGYSFEFYEGTVNFQVPQAAIINTDSIPHQNEVHKFYDQINKTDYKIILASLLHYKESHKLNDWLYYQLVRKTAQQLAPKKENYFRYTLYKWFLLSQSGFDARLAIANRKIIFYVRNEEDIMDIPFFKVEGNKYMCLNYHDYGKIDFAREVAIPVEINIPGATKEFSYKVTRMPEFKPENYSEKDLKFSYKQRVYHFKVKVNSEVQNIFANYPVVDFATYFNIPLSHETYGSLIPVLKKAVEGKSQKRGIEYLMNFTRYAFLYQDDSQLFGKEKRFAPEQTLFAEYSDCDDRAALFFYLVKEIYNLPMIALLYPTHITVAVAFDKPIGNPIIYQGKHYSICEPTPQGNNLKIGQVALKQQHTAYTVVYHYDPKNSN